MRFDLSGALTTLGNNPTIALLIQFIERWGILIGLISSGVLILSAGFSIILIIRLSPDYWSRFTPRTVFARHPIISVVRNIIAVLLFVVGIVMLFTPGQGVLTVFTAILISDLPFRKKMLSRLLKSVSIRKGLNRIRRQFSKEPFIFDTDTIDNEITQN